MAEVNIIEKIAKDILYDLDYNRAVEIEEDDDWAGSVQFQNLVESLGRVYSVGFDDGVEQVSRTF